MKRWINKAVCLALCAVLAAVGLMLRPSAADFYDKAELLEIKSHIEKDAGMSEYATVQGACTDGEYAYFAVQEYSTVILKYDLKTWKLKQRASVGGLGHANDMTYNSREDIILVANNEDDEDVLTVLDPDTLTKVKTVKVLQKKTAKEIAKEKAEKKYDTKDKNRDYKALKVYSIAYQEAEDRYVVGISGSYNFAILDKEFKVVKQYKGEKTGYTRQGCDCDDDYIYFPQSDGDNIVVIYDYAGKHVETVSLNHSHEVENLFHVGSDFYLTLHYYGNSVRRAGFSQDTQIRFGVKFDPASGKGKMEPTSVHYGEKTKLPKCRYQKPGYFFGGWKAQREFNGTWLGRRLGDTKDDWMRSEKIYDYTLLPDGATVSQLTRIGAVKLSAFWIKNAYEVNFDPGTGEGWMEPQITAYDAVYTVPENRFTRYGYIFIGYTAKRDADGRVYGYTVGSEQPRWLEPDDMSTPYLFAQGEKVRRLTYDGAVTFTAQFSTAFIYDESQRVLLSYLGTDEEVVIPNPTGELYKIAQGAFNHNDTVTELSIPESVEVLERGAVSDFTALEDILFTERFPSQFDSECIIDSGTQRIYLVIDGQPLFLGLYDDRYSADRIRRAGAAVMASCEP